MEILNKKELAIGAAARLQAAIEKVRLELPTCVFAPVSHKGVTRG